MQARIQAIEEIGEIAIRIHSALTDSKEVLRLYYQPAYDPVVQPQNQFSLPMQPRSNEENSPLNSFRRVSSRVWLNCIAKRFCAA